MPYAPYKYNPREMSAAERAATFCGRQLLLDRLVSAVKEQTGAGTIQHYLLLGPRGIGKTTLLLMLHDKVRTDPSLSGRWLSICFREEEFYVYTLRDLLALAMQNLSDEGNIPEAAAILEEAQAQSDDRMSLAILTDGLRRISKDCGKKLLLLIDNFDRVFPKNTQPAEDHRTFRRILSTESFLMVVGTSVKLFEEIAPYDEAFFNFFCPMHLDNLSENQIKELLLARAELDDNREFVSSYERQKAKIQAITYLTGGNPRLVLMLYDILSRRELLPVVAALRETVDNLTPLLKDILEDMPRQQSKTLDALQRLGGVASPSQIAEYSRLSLNAVTTQLGRLKEARFVESEGGGRGRPARYRVCDQMFRTWYQMRYLRPARRRIEFFVEFLRAWFSLEERREFLTDSHKDFKRYIAVGQIPRARQILANMEYFADSMEDAAERTKQLKRISDSYLEVNGVREAAASYAELAAARGLSRIKSEAAGYAAVGAKYMARKDLPHAIEALSEATRRDPANVDARLDLGICLGLFGDHEGALAQFDAVIGMTDCPPRRLVQALLNRGVSKGMTGDTEGEIADYTAVVDLDGAPPDQVANALFNRGVRKGMKGDTDGEIADYTAVVELDGAPKDQVAKALVNRGITKRMKGDTDGAIADYTAVMELNDTPPTLAALALANRGVAHLALGNHALAFADLNAASAFPGASRDAVFSAILRRAQAKENLGKINDALVDHARCAECGLSVRLVYAGLTGLVRLLCKEGRVDDAAIWAGRTAQLEPNDAPMERRLEARIEMVFETAAASSLEAAERMLDALLQNDPKELQERLSFLKPAVRFARTGDAKVLADLPNGERQMAERVAAGFKAPSEKGD